MRVHIKSILLLFSVKSNPLNRLSLNLYDIFCNKYFTFNRRLRFIIIPHQKFNRFITQKVWK
ncbi:hypothetical protein FHW89_005558 [Mucilaginibacter sp. SG564]|nr:hypothetical protein [Mucilaginibacter sp. SG564]